MNRFGRFARGRPRVVTAVVSIVGYALVVGAFGGLIPLPDIGIETVNRLSDAIAVINSVALLTLLAGLRFVRRGEIEKHRTAMLLAFSLIMLFLVLYLTKVGGGFEKRIVIEEGQFLSAYAGVLEPLYLAMLAIHVLLSIVAVPVVLHAVVLGLTYSNAELPETSHPRVGRIAVTAWSISLFLGVLTYILLNHVYSYEAVERGAVLFLLAVPAASSK